MADALYRWPEAARYARRVRKEKFQEHGGANAATRERFVTELQRVVWAYKLAEATINLPGTPEVPEIQVFTLECKGSDVSDSVLRTIDKAVQFPIVFEVTRGPSDDAEVRVVAAHKQLGAGAPKLSPYYSTEWQPAHAPRRPLPTAITLPALYAAILQALTQLGDRPGEELSEVAARLATVRRLERDIAVLERKLHAERQFNRKIELRRALRTKQRELEQQR